MPHYDLGVKLDGLSAFCGGGITGTTIGSVLYHDRRGPQGQKEAISRLRAGEVSLTATDKIRLSDYFNSKIAELAGRKVVTPPVGPIGADMWDWPLEEFFQALETAHPSDALRFAHAHWAIIDYLRNLEQYYDPEVPLALSHAGAGASQTRFPENAIKVDALKQPSVKFAPGETMTIEIGHRVERPSQGWLFYVRNPDLGGLRDRVDAPIWRQSSADFIRWHPSPFPIEVGYSGPIPGFPANLGPMEGEFTAYLMIEDANASGVRRCLEQDFNSPWRPDNPTYEPTLHMIAVGRRLFQRGRVDSSADYRPPRLLVRRYQVRRR